MGTLVSYQLDGSVATITMDDGKVNALSLQMLDGAGRGARSSHRRSSRRRAHRPRGHLLGRVRPEGAAGRWPRRGRRCAAASSWRSGSCRSRHRWSSHARATRSRWPCSCCCRATTGSVSTARTRSTRTRWPSGSRCRGPRSRSAGSGSTPAHFNRAVILAEVFSPADAVAAGFLDRVVPVSELHDVAASTAARLADLDADAHAASKARARSSSLDALRAAIEADDADFRPTT